VDLEKILDALSTIHQDLNDGSFFVKIFTLVSQRRKRALAKDADNLRRVCTEEYDELSRRLDRSKLQESCSVRNILKTRRLANLLINDKGELNVPLLNKTINLLSQNLYSIGPDRQYDSIRQEHLLKTLQLVQSSKDIQRQLKNIGRPHSNKIADQIISDTLQLSEKTVVTDAHARRAALSALICYLRQNVGSCFATAPCILVHEEQPVQFLTDINELINAGRLKRTWSGVEYSVPLSPTWGSGDLKKLVLVSRGDLWLSPGLIAACEAVQLIPTEDTLQEKSDKLKNLINHVFGKEQHQEFYISPEDILKLILLKHFNITENDLNEYQQRPQGMIQSGLMLQVPQSGTGIGGKGQACINFLIQYEAAKNAFKALADNALLKAWEFTVACFAENKSGFTRWNLYSSLGLGPQEKGGIGQNLYAFVQRKLEETNEKLKRLNEEHEQVYAQVKYMESRIQHASEREAQWLKAEYQSKRNEFYTFQELKDKTQMKSMRYANLFNVLIQYYDQLFPKYFQEVYDADMHDVSSGPYDDSPAGFRLLYKFGRSNTASWQRIYTPSQFVDALASFFSTTENEIASSEELVGMQEDYSEIVTAIISHIRTHEFLETAFYRMATAHHTRVINKPLEHLDQIEKKPWSYTSGGSMDTLVTTYFRRDQKPSEMSRWVENPTELHVFLVDILKQSPPKISDLFLQHPKKSMLMQSPTHAFLFKPGMQPLKEGWTTDAFTYTWLRDQWIKPREDFIERLRLNDDMLEYLVEYISNFVPENFRHFFRKNFSSMHGPMRTSDFRDIIFEGLSRELGLRSGGREVLSPDIIDGTLFSLLPMFSLDGLYDRVDHIFAELKDVFPFESRDIREAVGAIVKGSLGTKVVTAKALQDICKAIVCLFIDNTCSAVDFHQRIAQAAQKLGYAMPKPLLFADTNWVKDYFAFMVNPGTGRWELWRTDVLGTTGYPMSVWARWLEGSNRQAHWGVYNRPHEYTF
jgi:hypothetical protein